MAILQSVPAKNSLLYTIPLPYLIDLANHSQSFSYFPPTLTHDHNYSLGADDNRGGPVPATGLRWVIRRIYSRRGGSVRQGGHAQARRRTKVLPGECSGRSESVSCVWEGVM